MRKEIRILRNTVSTARTRVPGKGLRWRRRSSWWGIVPTVPKRVTIFPSDSQVWWSTRKRVHKRASASSKINQLSPCRRTVEDAYANDGNYGNTSAETDLFRSPGLFAELKRRLKPTPVQVWTLRTRWKTALLQILLRHRLALPLDVNLNQSSQFQILSCHLLELPPDVNLNQSPQLQTPLCHHNQVLPPDMRKIRHPVARFLTRPHVNRLKLTLTNVTSHPMSPDHVILWSPPSWMTKTQGYFQTIEQTCLPLMNSPPETYLTENYQGYRRPPLTASYQIQ